LTGFSPRELAIIANLARYHRRAEPSKRHAEFAQLSQPDQKLVLKLGGILRLADGLDRSHSQRIQQIHCEKEGRNLVLHLASQRDIAIEIWGAQQKAGLFEEVFKSRLRYNHVKP
jgi:exopolyphosphatase/guanosine-5'-triphosphate,3'-diphosphate pyrophosphatase